jgi:hypothetical protein
MDPQENARDSGAITGGGSARVGGGPPWGGGVRWPSSGAGMGSLELGELGV